MKESGTEGVVRSETEGKFPMGMICGPSAVGVAQWVDSSAGPSGCDFGGPGLSRRLRLWCTMAGGGGE